ncbi:SOS response-associated peptidase [Nitrosophilus kaiyonis]|uniref:SOS response-associated peptidase n=1 Tax=Nitrosophilus kaiyonis TaxID=2930200 RepID=UPI002490B610|nr:SOS response-associated peptidase [Nitrosophilus kaiyonis]
MCGRYTFYNTKTIIEELKRVGKPLKDDVSANFTPSYNIYPQSDIATALGLESFNHYRYTRWGLIPFWTDDITMGNKMINARAENLEDRPAFRKPFKRQRCIIPANGFYEWQRIPKSRKKIPYYYKPKDTDTFAFAGLFDYWNVPQSNEVIISSTIITVNANELIKEVHDRMPAILDFNDINVWLDSDYKNYDYLKSLLKPYPSNKMEGYMVSDYVNNPNNNDEKCIEPVKSLF